MFTKTEEFLTSRYGQAGELFAEAKNAGSTSSFALLVVRRQRDDWDSLGRALKKAWSDYNGPASIGF